MEVTEKQEASMFLRVFEQVRAGSGSSGDSTAGSTDAETSRLTARLSELMPKDYNPGFAFVVVQKRINTRIVAVNMRGNRVCKICFLLHIEPENFKKSSPKKLVKSKNSISRKFFWPNSIFCNFKSGQKSINLFLNREKVQNCQKCNFTKKFF